MSKPIKKYSTQNLDEATYLVLNGIECLDIEPVTYISTIFTFKENSYRKYWSNIFWTKGTKVNVHLWLSVRSEMKNLGRSALPQKKASRRRMQAADALKSPVPFNPKMGDAYWFPASRATVAYNVFGKDAFHQIRSMENKCFRTKDDAFNFSLTL